MAPPPVQFSNQFREGLRKIYELKPFLDVKIIDFKQLTTQEFKATGA